MKLSQVHQDILAVLANGEEMSEEALLRTLRLRSKQYSHTGALVVPLACLTGERYITARLDNHTPVGQYRKLLYRITEKGSNALKFDWFGNRL